MDEVKLKIKEIATNIEKLAASITTEEATKNAFIMPFIRALGYDVFNPLEVMPEYTQDIGTKARRAYRLCYFSKQRASTIN